MFIYNYVHVQELKAQINSHKSCRGTRKNLQFCTLSQSMFMWCITMYSLKFCVFTSASLPRLYPGCYSSNIFMTALKDESVVNCEDKQSVDSSGSQ